MTEYEKKWKENIPEETREHYKKAREEMREAVKGFLPEVLWNITATPAARCF